MSPLVASVMCQLYIKTHPHPMGAGPRSLEPKRHHGGGAFWRHRRPRCILILVGTPGAGFGSQPWRDPHQPSTFCGQRHLLQRLPERHPALSAPGATADLCCSPLPGLRTMPAQLSAGGDFPSAPTQMNLMRQALEFNSGGADASCFVDLL